MGNMSRLIGLPTADAVATAEATLRIAKNSIPVFWFGLFEPADERTFGLELEDGGSLAVPGLVTPTTVARNRWSERGPLLRSWLPSSLHHHIDAWRDFLDSVPRAYLGLDPGELGLVLEDSDLSSWLSQASGAFGTPTADNVLALFDVPGLGFDPSAGRLVDFDPEVVALALTGYGASD